MKHVTLDRPLVCFDLETTGIDPVRDRIVQLAIVRVEPDGTRTVFESLVDPGMPIPPEATRVHGIRDEDVAGQPDLAALADRVHALLDGADVAGFNSARFDLPFLSAELERVGRPLAPGGRRHIDAMRIFHQWERRDLTAAYRFYCGKPLEGAHSALADALATLEVLDHQFARYEDLPRDFDALHRLCNPDAGRFVDPGRKFAWNGHGEAVFTFGKYRGESLRAVAEANPDYLRWVSGADFDAEVKRIAARALEGSFPSKG